MYNLHESCDSDCIKLGVEVIRFQGWAVNTTPGIYHWNVPVFTGMENTPQSGKYWQILENIKF